ncbi:ribonuclease H-like domain-containing protein [Tanacetum coccineum]
MLDQRVALLPPLTETKTLGLPDVYCTVKGGGAIRLGMSRALQNWAPDQFLPPLKEGIIRKKLQKLMVIVLVEEVYVEALQVKYPIIDWEVYSEDTRRYWRIIRVGNHTEAYQIFADILKKFDRDDMLKLWDLVKKRFSTTEPTDDKEKELWVKLKRLLEPDNDDILWKLQRYMHDPLVWRLYDTCRKRT